MTTAPDAGSVERLRRAISNQLGLAFDDDKLAFLDGVLRTRADQLGIPVVAYCDSLESDTGTHDVGALAELITVGETYFFRSVAQLDAMRERALRECAQRAPGRKLRVLSSGCASGEEPYSIAMLLRDDPSQEFAAEITAFDINPAALARARRGVYSSWSLRETSARVQERWFQTKGRDLVLDPRIVADVTLLQGNLSTDSAVLRPLAYDIVFCRNVLMYFTPSACREAVNRIARAIVPGGFLFLGHAETLRGISQDFHLCHTHGTFYYQRKGTGITPLVAPEHGGRVEASTYVPAYAAADDWVDSIQRATDRIRTLASTSTEGGSAAHAHGPREIKLARIFDLLTNDQAADALEVARSMATSAQADPDALLIEAALLMQDGSFANAEDACRRLLQIDELHAGAYYILAMCCAGRNELSDAIRHNQTAAYLDPSFAMPRFQLGVLLRRSGDRVAARQELLKAQALLEREDVSRLLMFGGGFGRGALVALCRAEIEAGVAP